MTIEKAIDRLEDLHFEQDNWEDGELTEDCLLNKEALRQAIDIMRKYQKIKEIVRFGNANELGFEYVGEKITEVMEDGGKRDLANKTIEYLVYELVGYMRGYVGSSNCPYKYHLLMADDIKKPDCPSRSCEDCKNDFFEKLTDKMIDTYVVK